MINTMLPQQWIKKKNRRVRHARAKDDGEKVVPEAKQVKLTPWQVYMKEFGNSDGRC